MGIRRFCVRWDLALAPAIVILGATTALLFGGGSRGYGQALIAVGVTLIGAVGGLLVARPQRCPRCRRITETAEDASGLRLCARCWLDELGRPRAR